MNLTKDHHILTIIAASVLLSGCLVPYSGDTSVDLPGGEGWALKPEGERLELTLGDLDEFDFIVLELYHTTPSIHATYNGVWDFDGYDINPPHTEACILLSAGNDLGSITAIPPIFVPEQSFPGPIEIGPQPRAQIQIGNLEADQSIRTTGYGYSEGGIMLIGNDRDQSSFLVYGLANHAAWQQSGAEFTVTFDDEETFYYREVHRASMDCRVQFPDYDQGDYLRSSQVTIASNLEATVEISSGFVAIIEVSADLSRETRVTDPSGQTVHSSSADLLFDPTTAPEPEKITLCSGAAGNWEIGFPRLEGTDHRHVWANALILDLPEELHVLFGCD